MNENGRVVKTWYWNVARSMRAHGSHMHRNAITTNVSARLRRFHACQHAQATAGMASQNDDQVAGVVDDGRSCRWRSRSGRTRPA